MEIEDGAIARWLDPLTLTRGDSADVFLETRRTTTVEWRDGMPAEPRVAVEAGVSARHRRSGRDRLVFVSGVEEADIREAIRALQKPHGRPPPAPPRRSGAQTEPAPDPSVERWTRRLAPVFERHVPRHRFRWSLDEITRRVIPSGSPGSTPGRSTRRLFSLEGTFIAASRRGDETRSFSFHAPEADGTADELREALTRAAVARERPIPAGDAGGDVLFAAGTAAFLFHEILSHALEAGADENPLTLLAAARVSISDLDVRDDPMRLDLFGGYERDDEGTRARSVKLLDAGRVGGKLTDRAHAEARGSTGHGRRAGPGDLPLARGSNTLVSAGSGTSEEMTRRLGNGLWIDEIDSGAVELSSGRFRLQFPRARRIRRGRLAEEIGPGLVAGEMLAALSAVEPVLGRELHVCRSLGWCSRGGQVVPVQGEAPDVIIRRLSVRDR
jgi:predicted Zn-dependent protease